MAPSDVSKLTVPALRKELEKLGLDSTGLKAVLVERLTKAHEEAAAAPEPEPAPAPAPAVEEGADAAAADAAAAGAAAAKTAALEQAAGVTAAAEKAAAKKAAAEKAAAAFAAAAEKPASPIFLAVTVVSPSPCLHLAHAFCPPNPHRQVRVIYGEAG